MSASLFRPEVMNAQQAQWLGSIRIARPPGFALVTVLAVACAAALVAFAVWGEYTRKVTLPGVLMPEGGVMDISSPQGGTVSEVLVKEGDEVQAGQPLIRLRAERQLAAGELGQLQAAAVAQQRQSLETELRLLEQRTQQRSAALSDRLRSLKSDEGSLRGELEAVQQRVALADKSARNFEELAAKGFMSQLQAQQKQEELLDLGLRERNARRALEAAQREQVGIQAELALARTQLESERSQLQRQLAELTQEGSDLGARSAWTLTAPRAGRVATLIAVAGQAATAERTLATLLPAGATSEANLVAHLYAPSRMAGFVELGQPVWLRYAAYPYQKFGMQRGEVVAVSRSPVNPQDLPSGRSQALMQSVQAVEPLYRIQVSLARQHIQVQGELQPLKVGTALESQVRQEARAIWEWVLEPVLAVWAKGRV
ncbi:HlyD family secretion protein [Inhella proteolytica]|uniref:HlyD family efflux transporter periplasmic adaptor subunit n=1 Tax=Inhella proteolytica TaxID=2795029 RepID=A0A931IZ16_9BURK|nr:HlyD family efflux transporter periplasmic adaptor subunit [Inhella proteolytica]MBH9575366.1 HlyD family efflux transporter periplasmic adaptor subunit [Inhella proteolytica]